MPTIHEVIQQFESELDALVDDAARQMVDSYGAIYLRLRREADDLVAEVQRMREAGEDVSLNRLRNMERYKRLVRETKAEMDKYAVIVEDAVRRNGPGAALIGEAQAYQIMQARLAGYPPQVQASIIATFQRLPKQAIIEMVAALQEGSPLAKLLGTFGDEAAKIIGDGLLHGLAAGYNPRKVARELVKDAGMALTRALRISRTEMLRAHRMGNLAEYKANEHVVKGWRWHARMDERTCMSCIALHGTLHPLSEELTDHPNGRCHPAGVLTYGPAPAAATARYYRGQLLTVRTASGKELAITPNHPVLTGHGWISGYLLREGDYVISSTLGQEAAAAIHEHNYQVPVLIEKIVESFGMIFVEVPCTTKDFHGDGVGSEVYVVRTNGLLRDNDKPTLFQPSAHQYLGGRDIAGFDLAGLCSGTELRKRPFHTAHAILSYFDTAMMLLYGSLSGQKAIGRGLIPNLCAAGAQAHTYGATGDSIGLSQSILGFPGQIAVDDFRNGQATFGPGGLSGFDPGNPIALGFTAQQAARLQSIRKTLLASVEPLGKGLQALASNITLDRVLNVAIRAFEGHVYSLQTNTGWYIANGILVHNCAAIPETVKFRELGIDIDDPEPVVREGDGERWFREQPEDVQRRMMGEEKYKAWQENKFTFDQLSKATYDPDWGRMFSEASLKDLVEEA